ncbi:MAG: hypothetical protein P4L73_03490 [Caulobacteraceae bacterium]|nr:hypothetical protein [Caulobacteraceae bacterium]
MIDANELLEAIRNARAPSYQLDRAIGLFAGSLRLDERGRLYAPQGDSRVYGAFGDGILLTGRHVTSSIDAIRQLVEEAFPGWLWSVGRVGSGAWHANLIEPGGEGAAAAIHDSPALALCLAFVIAFAAERARKAVA